MAAVSAWSKPGAWALDSEACEAEQREKSYNSSSDSSAAAAPPPSADFPSLSDAAATKPSRKKKPQTFSLAEFATGNSVSHGAANAKQSSNSPSYKGLTHDDLCALPTGPRERSAEELERSSRGFGYSSYGLGRGARDGPRGGAATDESRRTREPSRDLGPSRTDEIDDWGAAKKSAPPPMFERRERGSGFFENNPSRTDETDSWVSKKSAPPPPLTDGRRSNGFDRERNRERIDSDSWGRKTSNGISPTTRPNYRDEIDADTWGKKKDVNNTSSGRPRIVLQPRTLPLADGNSNVEQKDQHPPKKTSNPFGEARPREDVGGKGAGLEGNR